MKIINNLINKVGNDKVEHYLVGAWITAMGIPFGWYGVLIAAIFTIVISIIKEKFLDDKFDILDIAAAILGIITSVIYSVYVLLIV